jgi:HK97 family phage prohead protease
MIRQTVPSSICQLGAGEVEVILSTGAKARDGHVLVPQGCDLAGYRENPIVLWQHDPTHPVGKASAITVGVDKITARVNFAPTGISALADEVRGLVKSGVISSLSVGFDPRDGEPLDPKRPRDASASRNGNYWNAVLCLCRPIPARSSSRARLGPAR